MKSKAKQREAKRSKTKQSEAKRSKAKQSEAKRAKRSKAKRSTLELVIGIPMPHVLKSELSRAINLQGMENL